jgi:hypothetical protein
MERVKNAGLLFCLFVVLLVIFSSYFRASELGTLFGALAGTPVLVHVFNRLAPRRPDSHRGGTSTGEPVARADAAAAGAGAGTSHGRPNGQR